MKNFFPLFLMTVFASISSSAEATSANVICSEKVFEYVQKFQSNKDKLQTFDIISKSRCHIDLLTINVLATFSANQSIQSTVTLGITPFATDRKGKIHKGATSFLNIPTNFPNSANPFALALNAIQINNPITGNYTVGYLVQEVAGSFNEPPANALTLSGLAIADFDSIQEITVFPLRDFPYVAFNGAIVIASDNLEVSSKIQIEN